MDITLIWILKQATVQQETENAKESMLKYQIEKKDIFISLIKLKSDMSMTVICHVMSIAVLYI